MCGIAGFVDSKKNEDWMERIARMTSMMAHRGPDDEGKFFDAETGVVFGHRRLSIVDLSPEGHQPMSSPNGRYEITFNGEIYNFRALKEELGRAGYGFRGHSDTEIMLAAFEEWGIRKSVERFIGMFAFAVLDRKERMLFLVRDRLGEKPLYYGWMNDVFLFASEMKALQAHPSWRGEIDRNALALFMRYGYIQAPHSIYEGIYKLQPGMILALPVAGANDPGSSDLVQYWSAKSVAEEGIANPFKGDDREAADALDNLLRDAIRQQMVADVPLGAFLSGGIDSSTIVALMQAMSDKPVKTFTIGFNEKDYDEAVYAKSVARHLGTDHTEMYVTAKDAMAVIPRLASIYDEPFGDSSQIPTFLVAELARRHVTVSLSGDAGDELFCGYTRYEIGRGIRESIYRLPVAARKVMASAMKATPVSAWDGLFKFASPFLNDNIQFTGDRVHKLAESLNVATPEAFYRHLVSIWKDTEQLVPNSSEPQTPFTDADLRSNIPGLSNRMMFVDTVSYLPDDILVKLDRASMAASLESRVPFLDHRVVEFAWRLPVSMKHRDGKGKWLLRQMLYKYVPKELIERPKMGFGVPIADWLRGPLREWAEALLDERRLREEGLLNPALVRKKWAEHLSGRRNWQYSLWNVLMFQMWLAQQASPALYCASLSAA
ncbi:MAG: asparagine synthase (glutamine-hydrolyzing) [Blastocatellia bacterium]